MFEASNETRADWAEECARLMQQLTGADLRTEAPGDLITNLCHLCRRYGLDPHVVVENAVAMFQTEEREDAPPVVERA